MIWYYVWCNLSESRLVNCQIVTLLLLVVMHFIFRLCYAWCLRYWWLCLLQSCWVLLHTHPVSQGHHCRFGNDTFDFEIYWYIVCVLWVLIITYFRNQLVRDLRTAVCIACFQLNDLCLYNTLCITECKLCMYTVLPTITLQEQMI